MANHGPWVGNYGYCAFATETTPGTAVTPSVFTLLENETMTTSGNLIDQTPIAGIPLQTYQVVRGLRNHKGDIEIVAEPNTASELVDSILVQSTLTPYTFTISSATVEAGATYTNNGQTFYVAASITSGTTLLTWGTGTPGASGTLTLSTNLTTGTGLPATITFSAKSATSQPPYGYNFAISGTSIPHSKTMDISMGAMVKRFVGVQSSKLSPSYNSNGEITLKATLSALASFQGGVIASVSGSGPTTITIDLSYGTPALNTLLTTNDTLTVYHPAATSYDTGTVIVSASTVTAVTATTVTISGNASTAVAGDMFYLAPQTVSFSLLNPFLWGNTQFCFGSNVANALVNTQTPVEQGSSCEINWAFEKDTGSPRSGSFDPAALIRTVASSSLTVKKYYDQPDDVVNFNQLNKTACVVRHFAYGGADQATTYELRFTYNHLVTDDPMAKLKSKDVNYETIKYKTQYDSVDAAEFSVQVINGLSSIT